VAERSGDTALDLLAVDAYWRGNPKRRRRFALPAHSKGGKREIATKVFIDVRQTLVCRSLLKRIDKLKFVAQSDVRIGADDDAFRR
jgi:hypothetical protein